jgi:hypothetical protein
MRPPGRARVRRHRGPDLTGRAGVLTLRHPNECLTSWTLTLALSPDDHHLWEATRETQYTG